VTVVGNVTSGRDAPVDDIASSVGLYINSLPLMMQWNTGLTLGEHIIALQRELMGLNEHATQSLIALKNGQPRCFDSLFVFENYPRSTTRTLQAESTAPLAPIFGQAYEKVEFPLNVVVTEVANRTSIRFEFDAAQVATDTADGVLAQWLAELLEIIRLPIDSDAHIQLRTCKPTVEMDLSKTDETMLADPALLTSVEWESLSAIVCTAWLSVASPASGRGEGIWQAMLSDLAINSLDVITLAATLSDVLGHPVTPAMVYQSPSPAAFVQSYWKALHWIKRPHQLEEGVSVSSKITQTGTSEASNAG
jgi:condensation domain-containing protein/phosphopantetheine binding protein